MKRVLYLINRYRDQNDLEPFMQNYMHMTIKPMCVMDEPVGLKNDENEIVAPVSNITLVKTDAYANGWKG